MEDPYALSYDLKKQFSVAELNDYTTLFKAKDTSNDGSIQKSELAQLLKDLGHRDITGDDLTVLLGKMDLDDSGNISFNEFLTFIYDITQQMKGESKAQTVHTTDKAGNQITETTGERGSKHTYSAEEKECFARVINETLKDDELCMSMELIPIDPKTNDLFHVVDNGVIFCKLVNKIQKDTVDERVLRNTKNIFQIKENLNLALSAIKSVGCKVISMDSELILKHTEHLILGLLWQLIRIIMVQDIDLKKVPEIIRLAEEDEEMTDLLALAPESLLVRWVNFHMKNSGSDRRVKNLGKDMADGVVYTTVINQLDSGAISMSNLDSDDHKERAQSVIESTEHLGFKAFIGANDIVTGNTKLNTVFTAELFNNKHGLAQLTQEEEEEFTSAQLIDDDVEGSREERAYRMWANSLGIDDFYINNLYEEAKEGQLLLKIMDRVQPECVNWKMVEKKAGKNQMKRNINCGIAVSTAKDLGCKIPGIDSSQILKGNKKAILAIVWQIVRLEYLKIIGGQSEKDLLKWANSLVTKEDLRVKSFRDKTISSGLWLIELCAGIEPRAINWEIVTTGESDEDKM